MKFLRKLFNRDPVCLIPEDPDEPWQSELHHELDPIARMLVVIKPKQPYHHWLQQHGNGPGRTLAQCRSEDSMAFLIPREDGEIEEAEHFVATCWQPFFAQMLSSWEVSPTTWPKDRTLVMFRHWFDVEIGEIVLDLGRYQE